MKKSVKILLSIMLIVTMALILVPSVKAQEAEMPKATIEMKVLGDGCFYVGEENQFEISTKVENVEEAKKCMVIGSGGINDASAVEELYYLEVNDGQWYPLPVGSTFGDPSKGFPLQNATSKFKAKFSKAGTYTVTYQVAKYGETGKVVAKGELKIEVKDTKEVSNEAELLAALKNDKIKEIKLKNDIETKAKVNVTRNVAIDGQNHTITLNNGDKTKWGGNYVLQAYKSNVTIKNIKLKGGNAALLVNGSNVTLEGTIDVSDNGFGGIELTKGSGVTETPSLTLKNATLVNTTEAYKLPTVWEDPEMADVTVDYPFANSIDVNVGDKVQKQYYLSIFNSVDSPEKQIEEQVDSGNVHVLAKTGDSISKDSLNSLKGKDVNVEISLDNGVTISFNGKDMEATFDKDLQLGVVVTADQPFESDVLDGDESEKLFVDLEYSGLLPKGTKIRFWTQDLYNVGDKLYLYYYNPDSDEIELISNSVGVDDDGYATISIDHASTYFLSKADLVNQLDNTPKTGIVDYTMIVASIVLISLAGVVILRKKCK